MVKGILAMAQHDLEHAARDAAQVGAWATYHRLCAELARRGRQNGQPVRVIRVQVRDSARVAA